MATGIAWQKYSPSDEPGFRYAAHAIKPHVVLVDDDELFRESLCPNLSDNGYEVTSLSGGVEALEYFNEGGSADVVLLDWRMPEIDGLEVLRRLRSDDRTRHLTVVALTSSNEEQDLIDSYNLHVNSYVRKPVDFVQFTEAVSQVGLYWLVLNEQPPVVWFW